MLKGIGGATGSQDCPAAAGRARLKRLRSALAAHEPNGGSVSEQALLFGVIRPLRSCPDTFGCVHIHFDDTAPPVPGLALGGALNAMPKHVDEDDHTTLTLTIPRRQICWESH